MPRSQRYITKNSMVMDALRNAILQGHLRPGDWIREDEWAARLGVSPTPVREALRQLEAQGLVENLPHRGVRVAHYSPDELVEVYLIRSALEGLAAKLAVNRSSEPEYERLLARLERINAQMRKALQDERWQDYRKYNRDFHMTLYAAAKAPRLLEMIENLWAVYPFDTLQIIPGRPSEAMREHEDVMAALEQRDRAATADRMAHHLERAAERLIEFLRQNDQRRTAEK